ncbi:MAG: SRPBCC family protein [Bdellovibrionales bacterium]|nr:SRPBCC family protein [Bdellovibrionales bacterium]
MLKKILLALVLALLAFVGYAATRDGHFRYERSGVIEAPAEKIYAYISDFHRGNEWSPYMQKDPSMKLAYSGTDGQPGAKLEFDGNKDTGSGTLEILRTVPNREVDIRLTMTKPFHAENLIEYRLVPEGTGTRFSWAMSGDGGLPGKIMALLIDCEKMVTKDFETGIANLKRVVESAK